MTDRIPCIGGPLDGQQLDVCTTTTRTAKILPTDELSCGYSREEFQGMRFFVADTMGFLAARREMRRLYAARNFDFGYAEESALRSIEQRARDLVEDCRRGGVVLTIIQRPLQPLGMAHYETVVEVRPVQVPTP